MARLVPFLALLAACVSGSRPIPKDWLSVPRAAHIDAVALDAEGKATQVPPRNLDGPIHIVEGSRLANGEKILTGPLGAIDSFDYSASRGEVVFSAKRDGDFDIGLVSSDGSPINWAPDDPADEIAVQWAPRGNKVSYIVRAKGGDVVRTLHIPTSHHLTAEFPNATIHALAWDPQGERYAVAYSTPDSSDRVEVLKYDGGARRTAIAPAVALDVDVEPFARDAVLLRPRDIRYEERLPIVIWVGEDFRWNDARASLMKNARAAVIVTTRPPDDVLWRTIEETQWIDAKRSFVVGAKAPPTRSAQLITGHPALPAGRYRRTGNVVAVAPAVVQSFAAGFIADQLKRITPTNARSR